MEILKKIATETNETLEVSGYINGKLIIANSPTIVSYTIQTDSFNIINQRTGLEVPFGVKAKDHNKILEWQKEYDKFNL